MRSKEVQVGEKKIIVAELRIKDILSLINKLIKEVNNIDKIKDMQIEELRDTLVNALMKYLGEIFELSEDEIMNAYPSELEELVGAFIDINFTALKKALSLATQIR